MNIAKYGNHIPQYALEYYLSSLIDRFYKILPLKEEAEPSLYGYMDSFIRELTGFESLFHSFHGDPRFISLISILQYMVDNPDCPVDIVRKEVFHAISICKCLRSAYADVNNQTAKQYRSSINDALGGHHTGG